MNALGVPAAAIRNIEQGVNDKHLHSPDMLHETDDGAGVAFLTAGSKLQMDDSPSTLGNRAPNLGEHADRVLKEWLGAQ